MQHVARRSGREDLLNADDPTARGEVAVWLSFFTGDFNNRYGGRPGERYDRRSIRTPLRATVEQPRQRLASSAAALHAALSAENGFEMSDASLRL
jgi:glutathione S-transferase